MARFVGIDALLDEDPTENGLNSYDSVLSYVRRSGYEVD